MARNSTNTPGSGVEGPKNSKTKNLINKEKEQILETLNNDVEKETKQKMDEIFDDPYFTSDLSDQDMADTRRTDYKHHQNMEERKRCAEQMDENVKEELIMQLGSELHDAWRNTRKKMDDGTYEPRMKKTKDEKWIKENGSDEVDIANTVFADLPADWQKENYEAAKLVIDLVYDKVISVYTKEYGYYRDVFDFKTIEDLSSDVHDSWMERNSWAKESSPELFVPYSELPESEKAKDRVQIIGAIEKVTKKMLEGSQEIGIF